MCESYRNITVGLETHGEARMVLQVLLIFSPFFRVLLKYCWFPVLYIVGSYACRNVLSRILKFSPGNPQSRALQKKFFLKAKLWNKWSVSVTSHFPFPDSFFLSFLSLCLRPVEVPGSGIEPVPQLQVEPLQWKCQIVNPLNYKRTPYDSFLKSISKIFTKWVIQIKKKCGTLDCAINVLG